MAATAGLIADPARTAMLMLLIDAWACLAGELAVAAGAKARTASSHLATLLAGGRVAVAREGQHRYDRLAGPQVGAVLERLAYLAPPDCRVGERKIRGRSACASRAAATTISPDGSASR